MRTTLASADRSSPVMRLTAVALWWVSLVAPIAGLLLFSWMPFKPALTVYAVVVGLGMLLRSIVEQALRRQEIRDIVRRHVHEYYAR